ncbi:MAG: Asp-tRNA(Asn)/Glu-tRNA(Gln) amidotransferase subunit GatB [bacterium]
MPKYVPIIGMEIHVELKTNSKMFCSCKNHPDEQKPNTNICEICLGHPGTLPVPNKKAIEWAVKIAKALNCNIADQSKFDRKNYFYPDLPKGYQISQYDQPIGKHGFIELAFPTGENSRDTAKIGITRVHLEEDTAKLTHGSKTDSLVDFNRSGIPLVEIVSEPDIQNATEAKKYCQELQLIFRHLGISDADMEKGHMRCEANISVQEAGKTEKKDGAIIGKKGYELNSKVELKNINSFRFISKAIDHEIDRQTKLIANGEKWEQQTRGWDDGKQQTYWQRSKETSADYRYFPEPDIPPFEPKKIAGKISIPELPHQKRGRFCEEFGLKPSDAELLAADKHWASYTENVMSELADWIENLPETKTGGQGVIDQLNIHTELARLAGGWLTSKLMGTMSDKKINITDLKTKPENFAELIALVYAKRVNSTNALKILNEMIEAKTDKDPTHIMEEKGYGQVSDEGKIGYIIDDVIKNYPKQVKEYRSGKEPVIKFLIGMAMKATEGSADPKVVEKLLKEKLN